MRASNIYSRALARWPSTPRFEALLVFLVTFSSLLSLRHLLLFTIFQERDLERARQMAKGQWIFFGPELSGGGHLPGAFYYYINAIPIWLGFDWEGAWVLNLMVAALTFALAWWGFRKYLSLEAAFAGCVSLICLPQFIKTFVYFQNFSMLPFFLVVALFGFAMAFAFETRNARGGWIAACAALGLGMQLHMSASFMVGAGAALQIFAGPLGLRRLPWRDFAFGVLALGLTVLPYYIWLNASKFGYAFGQVAPHYVGTAHFSLSSFQQTTAFTVDAEGFRQLWKRILLNKWGDEASLLISMPAAFIALAMGIKWMRVEGSTPQRGDSAALRVWLICALFSIPPAITIIFTPHRARYFTCAVIASIFAFTGWFEMMRRRRNADMGQVLILLSLAAVCLTGMLRLSKIRLLFLDNYLFWVAGAVALGFLSIWIFQQRRKPNLVYLLVIFFCGVFSHQGRFKDAYAKDNGPRLATLEAASTEIAKQTGWDWNTLRERLFLVNFHYQRSMATVYRQAAIQNRLPAALSEKPDGYFLVLDFQGKKKELQRYLTQMPLPPLLKRGIESGEIELKHAHSVPDGVLASYTVKDKLKYPAQFQNVGINYLEFSSDSSWHPDDKNVPVVRVDEDHVRFSFNDCPDLNSFCTVNFDVKRADSKYLDVQVTGDVISQPSIYISPNWSQSLLNLYLSAKCDAKSAAVEIPLIDQIGIVFDTIKIRRHLHSIVLAPVARRIENPCDGKIYALSIGYKASKMSISRQRGEILKGRELALQEF